MRGTRARKIRRESLPADLRDEMKDRIRTCAELRQQTIKTSRDAMNAAAAKAQASHRSISDAAWKTFEDQRAEIVEHFEGRAEARRESASEAA